MISILLITISGICALLAYGLNDTVKNPKNREIMNYGNFEYIDWEK